ncbi:MAG: hypothetical protein JWP57_1050 [Spirosoma sp.]|nr:hypothetical protein [Spirosoma sp.]
MKLSLLLLSILLYATACTKSVSPGENYLAAAAQHCSYLTNRLSWLQSIVTSGQYQKPDASLLTPIQQISLSDYGGGHVFLLDSDLSSCITCPWAILDCDGQPFVSSSSSEPLRDKVIWKK